ncbi:hypothetical protein B0H21DRAFT_7960 [Amylocystis lapponica]|nr:hypothetical protein B0H21DRAFT_7960 [Amylocystis lapponica]
MIIVHDGEERAYDERGEFAELGCGGRLRLKAEVVAGERRGARNEVERGMDGSYSSSSALFISDRRLPFGPHHFQAPRINLFINPFLFKLRHAATLPASPPPTTARTSLASCPHTRPALSNPACRSATSPPDSTATSHCPCTLAITPDLPRSPEASYPAALQQPIPLSTASQPRRGFGAPSAGSRDSLPMSGGDADHTTSMDQCNNLYLHGTSPSLPAALYVICASPCLCSITSGSGVHAVQKSYHCAGPAATFRHSCQPNIIEHRSHMSSRTSVGRTRTHSPPRQLLPSGGEQTQSNHSELTVIRKPVKP